MAKWNTGAKNGMWKGGRSVTSHGYVLRRVGKDHPLADCRGYAYEHRLIAQANSERKLRGRDQVHHDDRLKKNNDPRNLKIARSVAHHHVLAGTRNPRRRAKHGRNPLVSCACDCGRTFRKFDQWNRPRKFISGHNVGGKRDGHKNGD